jgi:uncharacterized lipoprotein
MKKTLIVGILAVIGLAGCGEQNPTDYSKDLSSEVPKPRANGPDFGAYKNKNVGPGGAAKTDDGSAKTGDGTAPEPPKRLPKGG